MTYEVELKFPLSDSADIEHRLEDLGARRSAPIEQRDLYFNHPSRDFGQTDEALRIRTVGTLNFVTYKGPLIDKQTKTRREIEIPLADGAQAAAQFAEMLTALGFREFRAVHKLRTPLHLRWEGRDVELALDNVTNLGRFLEIECLAEDSDRDAVTASVLRLAERLGLEKSERRSYLQLLVEQE
jgi:adenylate cyclase class 2